MIMTPDEDSSLQKQKSIFVTFEIFHSK